MFGDYKMHHKKIILFILILYSICSAVSYAKSSFGSTICNNRALYHCYKVKNHDTWAKLFTDEETRLLVKRINRMNTPLHAGMMIAIPENPQDLNMLDFAPFDTQISPPGKKII